MSTVWVDLSPPPRLASTFGQRNRVVDLKRRLGILASLVAVLVGGKGHGLDQRGQGVGGGLHGLVLSLKRLFRFSVLLGCHQRQQCSLMARRDQEPQRPALVH